MTRGLQSGLAYQTYVRSLNEAAILNVAPNGQVQTLGSANRYEGMINEQRLKPAIAALAGKPAGNAVDALHTESHLGADEIQLRPEHLPLRWPLR